MSSNKHTLHLIEIDTLKVTDTDIIVNYLSNEYTPIQISFSDIKTEYSISSGNTTLSAPDSNNYISRLLTGYKDGAIWNPPTDLKYKKVKIIKVVYDYLENNQVAEPLYPSNFTYPSDNLYPNSNIVDYGEMPASTDYPLLDLDGGGLANLQFFTIFSGYINNTSFTDGGITIDCLSAIPTLDKSCFTRTFDQKEFKTITDTMAESIEWG